MTATAHTLVYESRPWTLNVERQGNKWQRAKLVSEWRSEFKKLAEIYQVPSGEYVTVTVRPTYRTRRSLPDTAACVGAVKAAIDGLVDAGVLPDDGPEFVRRVTFHAPEVNGQPDALALTVEVHR